MAGKICNEMQFGYYKVIGSFPMDKTKLEKEFVRVQMQKTESYTLL
jgi:hypothetical protein